MDILTKHQVLPPAFKGASEDIRTHRQYIIDLDLNPESMDDTAFGTFYVFCSRHDMIHTTGWCSFLNVFKVPLYSESIGGAQKEYKMLLKHVDRKRIN